MSLRSDVLPVVPQQRPRKSSFFAFHEIPDVNFTSSKSQCTIRSFPVTNPSISDTLAYTFGSVPSWVAMIARLRCTVLMVGKQKGVTSIISLYDIPMYMFMARLAMIGWNLIWLDSPANLLQAFLMSEAMKSAYTSRSSLFSIEIRFSLCSSSIIARSIVVVASAPPLHELMYWNTC